jgi:hypothetical protein
MDKSEILDLASEKDSVKIIKFLLDNCNLSEGLIYSSLLWSARLVNYRAFEAIVASNKLNKDSYNIITPLLAQERKFQLLKLVINKVPDFVLDRTLLESVMSHIRSYDENKSPVVIEYILGLKKVSPEAIVKSLEMTNYSNEKTKEVNNILLSYYVETFLKNNAVSAKEASRAADHIYGVSEFTPIFNKYIDKKIFLT